MSLCVISTRVHPELGRTKIRFRSSKTDDLHIEAGRRLTKLGK